MGTSRHGWIGLRAVGRVGGLAAALLLAAVVTVGCATSLDDIEAEVGVTYVESGDNWFRPRVIQVPVGTEVTWEFVGRALHNVVGGGFQSELHRDGTFSHTFTAAGSFDYVCTLHAGMTGRVIVVAE